MMEDDETPPSRPAPAPTPSLVPPADPAPSDEARQAPPAPPPRASRAPAVSRSMPPLPAVEPVLVAADQARREERWDEALEHYKKALFLVGATDKGAQASLYADVAEVKLAQGKP